MDEIGLAVPWTFDDADSFDIYRHAEFQQSSFGESVVPTCEGLKLH
jgi:hypothetical protein